MIDVKHFNSPRTRLTKMLRKADVQHDQCLLLQRTLLNRITDTRTSIFAESNVLAGSKSFSVCYMSPNQPKNLITR